MLKTALSAFATFFATIDPVEAAVLFAAFCPRFSRAERSAISLKATGIILFFALFGTSILSALGVTFPALQAAGGVILSIIALDMSRIGRCIITRPKSVEARAKNDEIAVFPLATPILAGLGAMSGAMLLMANASGHVLNQIASLPRS